MFLVRDDVFWDTMGVWGSAHETAWKWENVVMYLLLVQIFIDHRPIIFYGRVISPAYKYCLVCGWFFPVERCWAASAKNAPYMCDVYAKDQTLVSHGESVSVSSFYQMPSTDVS